MLLLDTDHFSVLTDSRDASHLALVDRLRDAIEPVAIPVIAVEEQMRAWLAQIHRVRDPAKQVYPYDRLIRLFETLAEWEIVRWNEPAVLQYARLRQARIRIGTQDLKIAAMSLANSATLLSANLRDFVRIPGLSVLNWLHT